MAAAPLALATPGQPSGCRIQLGAIPRGHHCFGTCSVHGRVRLTVDAVEQSVRLARQHDLPLDEALPCPGPWRPEGVVAGPWGRKA